MKANRLPQALPKKDCGAVMCATYSKPSYKDIVLSLMAFIRSEVKDRKSSVSYRCPRPNCSNHNVTFKYNTRFKTQYFTLKPYYRNGRSLSEQE